MLQVGVLGSNAGGRSIEGTCGTYCHSSIDSSLITPVPDPDTIALNVKALVTN